MAVGVALLVMLLCFKLPKHKKYLVRTQAGIALVAAVAVIANLICTGPMATILTLVSGNGVITEETSDSAVALGEEIAGEGIVLLDNKTACCRCPRPM